MGGMTRLLLLLWAGVTVSTAMDLHKRIAVSVCDNNQRHHHVELKLPGGEKDICGGTLISDRWILTAKHCNDTPMAAYVGLHPSTEETRKKMEESIKPMTIRDDPVASPEGHDIMLVKLPKAVKSKDIKPVDLPTTDDCKNRPKIGAKVQIAGYGPTVDKGPLSDLLLCANTEVVVCDPVGIEIYPGRYFCGNTETLTAMKGDSGGGVLFNNTLYGVISEGIGHPYPMYFMDVCEYLPWINDTMNRPGKCTGRKCTIL